MNFVKRTIAVCTAVMLISGSAYASVLGSSKITGYTVPVGEGTYYTENVYYSDQSGVGKQTEHYIDYEFNSGVTPIVTNGAKLFGTTTISNEVKRLTQGGFTVVGGANADFFSFKTGVPMSNLIYDGKIVTKDASKQVGIGITEDGKSFVDECTLASVLIKEDGTETNIYNINKYRQPYSIYMMTSDFANSTKNTTKGIDVVLGSIEGEMKLGTQMSAIVESVDEYTGDIAIPQDKIIITVDSNAPAEFYEPVASLKVGEKVKISYGVIGDEKWKNVKTGIFSIGGRILTNGEVNSGLEAGASPRTAIGIKPDGGLLLYTIDGRQSGYSYGVQLKTLAQRMKELGCTDAINFDGGGSTSMVTMLPGEKQAALVNKPSDGKERACSTFLFFNNNLKPTGELGQLTVYPYVSYMLAGATKQLSVKAVDTSFYAMNTPNINYSVENGKLSTISEDGLFTAKESGSITVYAKSGEVTGSTEIVCLETPTDIVVKNKNTGYEVKTFDALPGTATVFSADAYGGFNKLESVDSSFSWSVDGKIGTITENGKFVASNNVGESGYIKCTVGNKTVSVPVKIKSTDNNIDEQNIPMINMSIENGKVTGKINTGYGYAVAKDGIILKADGKKIDFEYDEQNAAFIAPIESNAVKITAIVKNVMGYSNMGIVYNGDIKDKANTFSDTSKHWAKDVISYLQSLGIVNGETVDNKVKFNPDKEMTRSEFAVMMTKYLGLNADDYKDVSLPYSDVSSIPFWAVNSFKALYKEGIVKGQWVSNTETVAAPLSSINRAEVVTIMARTLPSGFAKDNLTAGDRADIPSWSLDGFKLMVKLGAVKGYEDGSLKPVRNVTKAEAAKIIYSIM